MNLASYFRHELEHITDMYKTITASIFLLIALVVQGFADKGTVLITGANRGLGLELTKHFIKDGYTVIGTARTPEKATELKTTKAEVLQLDVTSEESIAAMAKTLEGRSIDILVNNAGYFGPNLMTEKMDTLSTLTRAEMETCIAVNTLGPLFVTQALLPNIKAGKNPRIINISTRAAILNNKGAGRAYGYKVSKTALNMVTKNMSADPNLRGVIVVSLAPGHNKTDMGTKKGNLDPTKTMAIVQQLIVNFEKKHHGGFWFYDGSPRDW